MKSEVMRCARFTGRRCSRVSPDQRRWIHAEPGFLFPVRALSKVFRGKYLEALERAYRTGKLQLAAGTAQLAQHEVFEHWLRRLRLQPWVVYSKSPVAGPERVLAYLGRYTHRVAISNQRIVAVADDAVTFNYCDYAKGGCRKLMRLHPSEFIRRFLLHVLPDGFRRIRHFGLLAHRDRTERLARCRQLLGQCPPPPPSCETTQQLMLRLTGLDVSRCPTCGQGRLSAAILSPIVASVPAFDPWDTS